MKQREEFKEKYAARNATDGCERLSLVSLPGGCTSAQVEMGQMEGCVFVCGEERTTQVHTQISWKRRQWVAVLRCCARDNLLTHFKH